MSTPRALLARMVWNIADRRLAYDSFTWKIRDCNEKQVEHRRKKIARLRLGPNYPVPGPQDLLLSYPSNSMPFICDSGSPLRAAATTKPFVFEVPALLLSPSIIAVY